MNILSRNCWFFNNLLFILPGYGDIELGKPCNVYRRRQTEAKRKCGVKEALQLPPSSSSVERIESIG